MFGLNRRYSLSFTKEHMIVQKMRGIPKELFQNDFIKTNLLTTTKRMQSHIFRPLFLFLYSLHFGSSLTSDRI